MQVKPKKWETNINPTSSQWLDIYEGKLCSGRKTWTGTPPCARHWGHRGKQVSDLEEPRRATQRMTRVQRTTGKGGRRGRAPRGDSSSDDVSTDYTQDLKPLSKELSLLVSAGKGSGARREHRLLRCPFHSRHWRATKVRGMDTEISFFFFLIKHHVWPRPAPSQAARWALNLERRRRLGWYLEVA